MGQWGKPLAWQKSTAPLPCGPGSLASSLGAPWLAQGCPACLRPQREGDQASAYLGDVHNFDGSQLPGLDMAALAEEERRRESAGAPLPLEVAHPALL